MPALKNKDQKRLSGYGFSLEVEAIVAEVWLKNPKSGNAAGFVILYVFGMALFPYFFPASPVLAMVYESMAIGLCGALAVLGAALSLAAMGKVWNETDTEMFRNLYLSRSVLSHAYAKGWRRRMGPLSAGTLLFSFVSYGHPYLALAFLVSSVALAFGTSLIEVKTKAFVRYLEEVCAPVGERSNPCHGPRESLTIEGEFERVA